MSDAWDGSFGVAFGAAFGEAAAVESPAVERRAGYQSRELQARVAVQHHALQQRNAAVLLNLIQ